MSEKNHQKREANVGSLGARASRQHETSSTGLRKETFRDIITAARRGR